MQRKRPVRFYQPDNLNVQIKTHPANNQPARCGLALTGLLTTLPLFGQGTHL